MNTESLLIEGYFTDTASLRRWIGQCPEGLPAPLRPTTYGQHEVRNKRNSKPVEDESVFRAYLTEKGTGFLHGSRILIDWSFHEREKSKLGSECKIWAKSGRIAELAAHGEQLLAEWSAAHCRYAFGAMWSEYRARNGYSYAIGTKGHRCEGWAGRDNTKYAPGLYWINYFSHEYAAAMKINPDAIAAELGSTLLVVEHGTVLRLYDAPENWISNVDRVAEVLRRHKGFFNIENVPLPVHPLDLREDLEWGSRIFQNWP